MLLLRNTAQHPTIPFKSSPSTMGYRHISPPFMHAREMGKVSHSRCPHCFRHRDTAGIFQLTRSSLARTSSTSRSLLVLRILLLPLALLSVGGIAKLTMLSESPSRFRRRSLVPRCVFPVVEFPPPLLTALNESLSLPSIPPRLRPPSYLTDLGFPRRNRSERGVQPSPPAKISSMHSSGLSSPA